MEAVSEFKTHIERDRIFQPKRRIGKERPEADSFTLPALFGRGLGPQDGAKRGVEYHAGRVARGVTPIEILLADDAVGVDDVNAGDGNPMKTASAASSNRMIGLDQRFQYDKLVDRCRVRGREQVMADAELVDKPAVFLGRVVTDRVGFNVVVPKFVDPALQLHELRAAVRVTASRAEKEDNCAAAPFPPMKIDLISRAD